MGEIVKILSLIIAAWNVIPSQRRRFARLFFTKKHLVIAIVSILFFFYLFAFDWLIYWFSSLQIFTSSYGIPAEQIAYFVLLMLILLGFLQILLGFFPRKNLEQTISFYRQLLYNNEYQLLIDNIRKYHLNDIKKYLVSKKELEWDFFKIIEKPETPNDSKYESVREQFAKNVFHQIIASPSFANGATKQDPYLIAEIFDADISIGYSEILNEYTKALYDSKNDAFISELKHVDGVLEPISETLNSYNLQILRMLFKSISFAEKNKIWYSIGRSMSRSLKYDKEQSKWLNEAYDPTLISDEHIQWESKVYPGIIFFNTMIREAIYQNGQYHMWLFFMDRAVEGIVKQFELNSSIDYSREFPTFGHNLIYEILDNMYDWLELSVSEGNVDFINSIITCISKCIFIIATSNEQTTPYETFKKDRMGSFFRHYFEFEQKTRFVSDSESETNEKSVAQKIVDEMAKSLNPRTWTYSGNLTFFKETIIDSWEDFDKIPYDDRIEGKRLSDLFEINIITPIRTH